VTWDLVIKGGRVIDGTGMRGFSADVAVLDGRIARIGRVDGAARRVFDATGLVVAPGFIDVHTHYDVQLDWDPIASPSSWHGVTTVLAGNCGFTLAPSRPEDLDWLAGMLSRVEGMSRAALREGLRFRGGGFADFWGRFRGRIGVNVGGYVGHSAVRRFVMGDDASEREARPEEVLAMQELVRQAMAEGAVGFSTSQLDIHTGEDGRGVPSNHASAQEILALASVLAEFGRGAIEIIPRSFNIGFDEADRRLLQDLYRVSGRPIELSPLFPSAANPMGWRRALDFVNESSAQGIRLHPMFFSNKIEAHLRLQGTFLFDEFPIWRETLTLPEPERSRALADAGVRERLRADLKRTEGRSFVVEWHTMVIEEATVAQNEKLVGRNIADLARERGVDPLDCFLDLALSEDLRMNFETHADAEGQKFIAEVVRETIRDPLVMAGASDGGAHLASFSGADYTTRLITDWVPDPLSLEQAIYRLTQMPASVHGLKGRGILAVGAQADITVFDVDRLGSGKARLVEDFPANSARYVVDATGYELTVVNGEIVMEAGKPSGALPGEVLHGG
jgi:N-acyl-D-aspartate/D-glutamate deacylase